MARVAFCASVRADEDLPRLGAVGRADDALPLHRFDDFRGAVVADAELALDPRSRALAGFRDDLDGFVVERVAFGVPRVGFRFFVTTPNDRAVARARNSSARTFSSP